MQMEPDETWIWKMKVRTTGSGHRYKFKAWRQGEPEPNDWLFNVLEPLHEPGFGSIGLIDDYLKVSRGASGGLKARTKLLGQRLVALIAATSAAACRFRTLFH